MTGDTRRLLRADVAPLCSFQEDCIQEAMLENKVESEPQTSQHVTAQGDSTSPAVLMGASPSDDCVTRRVMPSTPT